LSPFGHSKGQLYAGSGGIQDPEYTVLYEALLLGAGGRRLCDLVSGFGRGSSAALPDPDAFGQRLCATVEDVDEPAFHSGEPESMGD
jgi:hypothetical protein